MAGPVVGPIAGGFIAQTVGIKYVFVTIAGESFKLLTPYTSKARLFIQVLEDLLQ
jgi:hypothetical protein